MNTVIKNRTESITHDSAGRDVRIGRAGRAGRAGGAGRAGRAGGCSKGKDRIKNT